MPDYPLSEKIPERLKTPSGLAFQDITLEAVLDGKVGMEDLRVTSEALEMQAQVAEAAGRPQLAENLRRAAELVNVPEERILEIYNALRPGRADPRALFALADDIEQRYQAKRCAALVREAAG
jgi:propanediol dehydratase small subunit